MVKPKIVSLMPTSMEQHITWLDPGLDLSTVDLVVISPPQATEEQICEAVRGASAIIGDYSAHNFITRKVLQEAEGCSIVQFGSVGYEGVDLKAAKELGVPVCNGFQDGVSVAEHALMLILALLRRIIYAHETLSKGKWTQWELRGKIQPFNGKTLGILGLGTIGTQVAIRARAFGPKMIYNKRTRLPEDEERRLGIEYRTFQRLLEESDIITIHVPLTEETRGMIGEAEFARMKDGAILLNVARKDVVDEAALAEAFRAGKLSGAAVDYEPFDPESPLIGLDNVILTPHVAAMGTAPESQAATIKKWGNNIARAIAGESPENIVNDL